MKLLPLIDSTILNGVVERGAFQRGLLERLIQAQTVPLDTSPISQEESTMPVSKKAFPVLRKSHETGEIISSSMG
jgi:hypothetical protein